MPLMGLPKSILIMFSTCSMKFYNVLSWFLLGFKCPPPMGHTPICPLCWAVVVLRLLPVMVFPLLGCSCAHMSPNLGLAFAGLWLCKCFPRSCSCLCLAVDVNMFPPFMVLSGDHWKEGAMDIFPAKEGKYPQFPCQGGETWQYLPYWQWDHSLDLVKKSIKSFPLFNLRKVTLDFLRRLSEPKLLTHICPLLLGCVCASLVTIPER